MRPALLLLAFAVLAMPAASAQPATATVSPAAEDDFDRGLRLYRSGRYADAYDAFIRSATGYGYTQRTTAATLMAAKSAYAAGDLEAAASAATTFEREFPRSRYLDAVREVRERALMRLRGAGTAVVEPVTLGITLPLGADDFVFSQALFNGIRLAVEEYNAAGVGHPVRMVFRDSGGRAESAAGAVRAFARRNDTGIVIGPLYSEEAVAAGEVAEGEDVLLLVPLATDARVSEGRRSVFQANPTFEQRGRYLGRYAAATIDGPVAAVAEAGTFGQTMAEAFRESVEAGGGEVAFVELLLNEGNWFQLGEAVGADSLAAVEAVYFPVTGSGAPQLASGVLRNLDRLYDGDAERAPRILGSGEWHDLQAADLAERYGVTYTQDFFVRAGDPAVQDFVRRYRALAEADPDRLAYAGYDLTRMVLGLLPERRPEESVADLLRRAAPYRGLGHRIDFGGGTVNEALFLLGYRGGEPVQVAEAGQHQPHPGAGAVERRVPPVFNPAGPVAVDLCGTVPSLSPPPPRMSVRPLLLCATVLLAGSGGLLAGCSGSGGVRSASAEEACASTAIRDAVRVPAMKARLCMLALP